MDTRDDGGAELIRAFLALEIPDEIRAEMARWQMRWRERVGRTRWVKPTNQHLTIKFLGEQEPGVLGRLVQQLREPVRALRPIRVALAGTGFFPNSRRARVAWIGGRADGVEALVEVAERAAEAVGVARERRPWSLHLTQARLKQAWPREAVERFLEEGRELSFESFTASEMILFSSRLEPTGAVYTALERFAIG